MRKKIMPENLEFEFELEPEETSGTDRIETPFDPTLIKISNRPTTIGLLLTRIREGEIDLSPSFQRKGGIWSEQAKSRLIESLLIRIPLPAFYVDATDEDCWVVIDGLQRLTVLRQFVLDGTMRLRGLEFLSQFEGKTFESLPRSFQRRVEETQVTVFAIEPPTPPEAKFNIFKRINTGGLPLSAQEIRHALNPGTVIDFLADLASSPEFLEATAGGVKDDRMADRECVLRFFAFWLTPYEQYVVKEFDSFLNDTMVTLNKVTPSERKKLARQFRRSMEAASQIFGDHAFRKQYPYDRRKWPINKALFEAWSVSLARCTDAGISRLIERRDDLNELFMDAMTEVEFANSVSQGTGDVRKVKTRFRRVEAIIEEVLQ